MKIELIETIYSYRIKIPKLTDNQYLDLCKVLETTLLDEDTRMGEEENHLIIKTSESLEYVQSTLKECLEFAKSKPTILTKPIKAGELQLNDKFLVDGYYTVYKNIVNTNELLEDRIKGEGNKGNYMYLRSDCLVHLIDTNLNYVRF